MPLHIIFERLNFRQNGQVDSKKHKFSRKPLKKLISGFTPEVIENVMGCLKSCSGIPCPGTFPILKIATLFPEFQQQKTFKEIN
jgi:hypothetical protein